jgi:hypothetical protein
LAGNAQLDETEIANVCGYNLPLVVIDNEGSYPGLYTDLGRCPNGPEGSCGINGGLCDEFALEDDFFACD